MAAYALSNFHEAMRTLLGDGGDPVGGYDYATEQLDGALRTAIRMGTVPWVTIDTNPAQLVAAPANADTWGYLVSTAAISMIGGGLQESVRTRAMSVIVDPASRRDAVNFLTTMIADLDARGNVGGTAEDTGHKGLFACEGDLLTYIGFCIPPVDTTPCVTS